jgi:hypothetical protein
MSLLSLHTQKTGLIRAGLEAYYDFKKQNLLQYSEQFDNVVWGAGNVTPDQAISPRGDMTADQVEDQNGAAATIGTQAAPIISSSDDYTFSVYVKKDNDETRFPEFRIQPTGGATEPLTAGQINTKTGQVSLRTGSGSVTATDEGDYWRVSVTESDNDSGNTAVECSILPTFANTLGGAEDASLTGSIILWGGQLNSGTIAVSYEQTTDNQTAFDVSGKGQHGTLGPSAGIDVNDPTWRTHRLNFDGTNDYVLSPSAVTQNSDALTMQIVFKKTVGSTGGGHRTLFGHNGGGSYIRFFTDTTIGFWLNATTSSALVQGTAGGIADDGQWKMMTFRWRSAIVQDQVLNLDQRVAFNETTPAEGSMDTTYRAIGMYANGNYFDGEIAAALYYRRLLTDPEVARNYQVVRSALAPRGIALP